MSFADASQNRLLALEQELQQRRSQTSEYEQTWHPSYELPDPSWDDDLDQPDEPAYQALVSLLPIRAGCSSANQPTRDRDLDDDLPSSLNFPPFSPSLAAPSPPPPPRRHLPSPSCHHPPTSPPTSTPPTLPQPDPSYATLAWMLQSTQPSSTASPDEAEALFLDLAPAVDITAEAIARPDPPPTSRD